MNITVALVLAAGAGSRMRSSVPKVLHPIAGKSMLAHVIHSAAQVADAVMAVVGYRSDLVEAELEKIAPELSVPLYHAIQYNPMGTADATAQGVLSAMEAELNPQQILITYGDVPLLEPETLSEILAAHHASEATVTIATFIAADPTGYGRIIRTPEGYINKIVEHRDASAEQKLITEVNAGIYVIDTSFLVQNLPKISAANQQTEKYLTDIIELAVEAGRVVTGFIVSDVPQLSGCNDQHQLLAARQEYNNRIILKHLTNGVRIDDPTTTWIDCTVKIDSDAIIYPGTFIRGDSHIHAHAIIGPNSRITDSDIGQRTEIFYSEVIQATIGANCTIGPYSYIRPDTFLQDNVKVGAFVETKNISVGHDSKIPHLSYIGDATIGESTNIGAGAIIVNYDGENKHHSAIGDHVRIGSNSSIISPVNIGDGAYTGADSVINHDVPPGALALSQGNKQRIIPGWVFRKRGESESAQAASNSYMDSFSDALSDNSLQPENGETAYDA